MIKIHGRVLQWQALGDTFHTSSPRASAIIYPYEGGYHWEVFVGQALTLHGQVKTLEGVINHVEGNVLAREMTLTLSSPSEGQPGLVVACEACQASSLVCEHEGLELGDQRRRNPN